VGEFVFVFHGTPPVMKFRVAQQPLLAAIMILDLCFYMDEEPGIEHNEAEYGRTFSR